MSNERHNLIIDRYLTDGIASQTNSEFWQGLRDFKGNIIRSLDIIPDDAPILLSGDWGAGKTSLLRALEEELNKNNYERSLNQGKYKAIWFDAWRYENEDGLLQSLIRRIWEEDSFATMQVGHETKAVFETTLKTASVVTLRALPMILSFISGGALNEGLLSKVFKGFNTKSLKNEFGALNYSPTQSQVDKLTRSFAKLVEKTTHEHETLVIIIDDLDRCNPESAIDLLDQIRQLLNTIGSGGTTDNQNKRRFRFIVAMDKITLTESVAKKYEGINSYDGNRYLEKLFPFNFQIPVLVESDIYGFVMSQIRKLIGETQGENINCYGYKIKEVAQLLANVLKHEQFANPRLIKRCINQFFMYCAFEKELNEKDESNDNINNGTQNKERSKDKIQLTLIPLITWIAATERWPILRRLLLQKYVEFWHQIQACITEQKPIDDAEARQLMAYRGFKTFFQKTVAHDIDKTIGQFKKSELKLRTHGL